MRSDLVGSVSVWAFSVPGLVLSALLTVLRLRSDHRCDDTFMGACSGGGLLSCSTVLGDAWATVLGLPLTVYASAYFLVTLALAGATLLSPRTLRPLVRPVLLLASWAGLAVALALAVYAVFGLGALCLYCVFLDGVCLGVFLAAVLANRGRVLPRLPGLHGHGLPSIINTSISVLKDSAYLSVIAFAEITYVAMNIVANDFRVFEMFAVLGARKSTSRWSMRR